MVSKASLTPRYGWRRAAFSLCISKKICGTVQLRLVGVRIAL